MAMKRNYFTVLFFLKKSKLLKNGEAPICIHITINGKHAGIQIKQGIDAAKWNYAKLSINNILIFNDYKLLEIFLSSVSSLTPDVFMFSSKRSILRLPGMGMMYGFL